MFTVPNVLVRDTDDVKHMNGGCETVRLGGWRVWRHWVCSRGSQVASCDGTDRVMTRNTVCGLAVLHAVKWAGRAMGRDAVCDRVSGLGCDT